MLQCWKWRQQGSRQNLPTSAPIFRLHLRAGSTVGCCLLPLVLLLDGGGYGLPLVFRVALTWPISKLLSDSVPVIFFPKQAWILPIILCAHIFLDNGYLSFIVSTHYYVLLIYICFNPHISWTRLELSPFLKITLNFWNSCLHLPSAVMILKGHHNSECFSSMMMSFVV